MSEPKVLYGGDPCPLCGLILDYEEDRDGDIWLIHPEPSCGWIPSGYPSTRRGAEDGRHPPGAPEQDPRESDSEDDLHPPVQMPDVVALGSGPWSGAPGPGRGRFIPRGW